MRRLALLLVLAACALGAGGAVAGEPAGRVPKPVIEAARGERCVEDADYMRRNHMNLLKHQRDEAVHKGVRERRHSLVGCIECHASRRTGSVVASGENFCQSCHSYVAVKLDCFECHASRPAAVAGARP